MKHFETSPTLSALTNGKAIGQLLVGDQVPPAGGKVLQQLEDVLPKDDQVLVALHWLVLQRADEGLKGGPLLLAAKHILGLLISVDQDQARQVPCDLLEELGLLLQLAQVVVNQLGVAKVELADGHQKVPPRRVRRHLEKVEVDENVAALLQQVHLGKVQPVQAADHVNEVRRHAVDVLGAVPQQLRHHRPNQRLISAAVAGKKHQQVAQLVEADGLRGVEKTRRLVLDLQQNLRRKVARVLDEADEVGEGGELHGVQAIVDVSIN
ncbi:hypothetical protein TYRP_022778 [Tyrophagus putrescentiae]|nr:hypothetical protein TYRP_022778 [Tyrophagus putrescentiae]